MECCKNSHSNKNMPIGIKENNLFDNSETIVSLRDLTNQTIIFVDSIITNLSLEEVVGQLFMPALNADTTYRNTALLKKYIEDDHVGGIVIMNGSIEAVRIINHISKMSKIPMFIAIDAEWGLGMRLLGAPVYPKNGYIKEDIEEINLYDYGREVAIQCGDIGINMVLGPVIDVNSTGEGFIGKRSFGNDPVKVARLGVAYAKGLESAGVISIAKHFPGHGSSIIDSHKIAAVNKKNISELDTIDFLPFRLYIDNGLTGIMAGHILLPSIDKEGLPASVSETVLKVLLRDEMGFTGLVLTDAFNMGGVKGYEPWQSLKSGADIVLCPENVEEAIKETIYQIRKGELDYKEIIEHCRRIIFTKAIFGLWN